jgi:hypothetical protein
MDFRPKICSVAPQTEGPTDRGRYRIAEHGLHLHKRPSGDSFAHRLSCPFPLQLLPLMLLMLRIQSARIII